MTMQSKMTKLIWEKIIQSQKKAIFQGKKKVRLKLYTSRTNTINPGEHFIPETYKLSAILLSFE